MSKVRTKGKNTTARELTYTALCVAMLAICSWISIPIPGTSVPINLATFAVLLAGLVLGRRDSVVAVAVFLLLGAVGVPVFHGFTGGLGILAGPTGGYLIGYLALAFAAGVAADVGKFGARRYALCAVAGELALYVLGTAWFLHVAGSGFSRASVVAALMMCVVPFIPGDIAKAVVAYIAGKRLRRIVE